MKAQGIFKAFQPVPISVQETPQGDRAYDVFSRLYSHRIIMLGSEINDDVANIVVTQLLQLNYENASKDIIMFINSPGGVVTAGMAIIDVMNLISAPVSTICMGQCSSMGATILAAGAKGKRFALKHSRVMIHQPLGGFQGQVTDIELHAEQAKKTKTMLTKSLSRSTGKAFEQVLHDCERDNYMDADEAVAYGLVDAILSDLSQLAPQPVPAESVENVEVVSSDLEVVSSEAAGVAI